MAPRVRLLVRHRARVMPGSATGIDRQCTGSRRGDRSGGAQCTRRPLTGPACFSAIYGTTVVTDRPFMASKRSQRPREGRAASGPVRKPREQPRVLDGGDARTRRAGWLESPPPSSPRGRTHMAVMTEQAADDTTIRPFTIDVPQADL